MFSILRAGITIVVLAFAPCAGAPSAAEALPVEITDIRIGAHVKFTRLVVVASGPLAYRAAAIGERDFVLTLNNAVWRGSLDHRPVHGMIDGVSLTEKGGDLQIHVTSRHRALITRAFDLRAMAPPGMAKAADLSRRNRGRRIILDLARATDWMRSGGGPQVAGTSTVVDLPPMHGIKAETSHAALAIKTLEAKRRAAPKRPLVRPVTRSPARLSAAPQIETATRQGAALPVVFDWPSVGARYGRASLVKPDPGDEIQLPTPEPITLSWSRASKILQDIYNHVDPNAIGPGPKPVQLAPVVGQRIQLRPPPGVRP